MLRDDDGPVSAAKMPAPSIVDLFAGPGGWDEGLAMIGRRDVVGIEHDLAACQTAVAAGHRRILADVAQYPPERFAGYEGLIASPPCQDFSAAGKRVGRTGAKGELIDMVPPWVEAVQPEWIACEQVPPALPVWEEFARLFRSWGYSAWCGVLNAADFGVPQTRTRAILLASRVAAALPPEPTHAKNPEPGLFGTCEPWVSMAQAFGWDDGRVLNQWRGEGMVERHGERPDRTMDEPAFTVTGACTRTMRWVVSTGDHSKTARGPEDYERAIDRPAPTVDTKAGQAWFVHQQGMRDEAMEAGGRKLTVAQVLRLQSFRGDYPVRGGKTKAFEQIGNAVPPLLAAHVLGAATKAPITALAGAAA